MLMASKKAAAAVLNAAKRRRPSPEQKDMKALARAAWLERKSGLKEVRSLGISRTVLIGCGKEPESRGAAPYQSAREIARQRSLERAREISWKTCDML